MLTTAKGWLAASSVVAVLLSTAVWFLVISPTRAEAAATRELTVAAEANNAQLVVRLEQLEQQFIELPAKEAELAAVRVAMPEDDAVPELIRTVDAYAADTGVTLMSMAPGAPVVPAAPAPVAPAAPAADGTVAPAPVAPTGPVTVSIPLVTTVVGDYFEVKAFLEKLQTGTRAHLVTDLSLTAETPAAATGGKPATQAGDVTMTVTGSIFALRDPAAVTATPVASPSPGAAPAPSTTPDAAPVAVAS